MAESDFDTVNAGELKEGGRSVPSGTQHAHVADATESTTAPAPVTATAPAGATVGANIGAFTDPPTAGEMATLVTFVNALKADNADLRTKLAAAVVDITALQGKLGTLVTDVGGNTTKINGIFDTLEAFQENATS